MTDNDLVALMTVLSPRVECGVLRGSVEFEVLHLAQTGYSPVSPYIVVRASRGIQCYDGDTEPLRATANFFVSVGQSMTHLADKADAIIERCKQP